MMAEGLFYTTVTLIIILLLFKRISIVIIKHNKFYVVIDTGLLTVTLSDSKEKKDKKRRYLDYLPPLRYLLRGSHVSIDRLILADLCDPSLNHIKKLSLYSLFSSLSVMLLCDARKVSYNDEGYLIDVCEVGAPEISVRVEFSLIRMIISLILAAYYKIKYTVRRGIKNV